MRAEPPSTVDNPPTPPNAPGLLQKRRAPPSRSRTKHALKPKPPPRGLNRAHTASIFTDPRVKPPRPIRSKSPSPRPDLNEKGPQRVQSLKIKKAAPKPPDSGARRARTHTPHAWTDAVNKSRPRRSPEPPKHLSVEESVGDIPEYAHFADSRTSHNNPRNRINVSRSREAAGPVFYNSVSYVTERGIDPLRDNGDRRDSVDSDASSDASEDQGVSSFEGGHSSLSTPQDPLSLGDELDDVPDDSTGGGSSLKPDVTSKLGIVQESKLATEINPQINFNEIENPLVEPLSQKKSLRDVKTVSEELKGMKAEGTASRLKQVFESMQKVHTAPPHVGLERERLRGRSAVKRFSLALQTEKPIQKDGPSTNTNIKNEVSQLARAKTMSNLKNMFQSKINAANTTKLRNSKPIRTSRAQGSLFGGVRNRQTLQYKAVLRSLKVLAGEMQVDFKKSCEVSEITEYILLRDTNMYADREGKDTIRSLKEGNLVEVTNRRLLSRKSVLSERVDIVTVIFDEIEGFVRTSTFRGQVITCPNDDEIIDSANLVTEFTELIQSIEKQLSDAVKNCAVVTEEDIMSACAGAREENLIAIKGALSGFELVTSVDQLNSLQSPKPMVTSTGSVRSHTEKYRTLSVQAKKEMEILRKNSFENRQSSSRSPRTFETPDDPKLETAISRSMTENESSRVENKASQEKVDIPAEVSVSKNVVDPIEQDALKIDEFDEENIEAREEKSNNVESVLPASKEESGIASLMDQMDDEPEEEVLPAIEPDLNELPTIASRVEDSLNDVISPDLSMESPPGPPGGTKPHVMRQRSTGDPAKDIPKPVRAQTTRIHALRKGARSGTSPILLSTSQTARDFTRAKSAGHGDRIRTMLPTFSLSSGIDLDSARKLPAYQNSCPQPSRSDPPVKPGKLTSSHTTKSKLDWLMGEDNSSINLKQPARKKKKIEQLTPLKTCSVDGIIDRCVHPELQGKEYKHVLLLCHSGFISTEDLLEMFLNRYLDKDVDRYFIDNEEEDFRAELRPKLLKNRRLKIVIVLKYWMQNFPEDFRSTEIREQTSRIIQQIIECEEEGGSGKKKAEQLHKALHNTKRDSKHQFDKQNRSGNYMAQCPEPKIKAEVIRTDTVDLMTVSCEEIARQLCLCDFEIFIKIEPREFMGQNWAKRKHLAPNVVAMIDQFNKINFWTQHCILSKPQGKKRAECLGRLLRVCSYLEKMNNLNSLAAINAGLRATAIHRLKKTFARLNTGQKRLFDKYGAMFRVAGNYPELRKATKLLNQPAIPHLALFLTDLTFIEDGNKDTKQGLINYRKYELLSERVGWVRMFQQYPFQFKPVPPIRKYFDSTMKVLPEDFLYNLSLQYEPREEH